VERRVHRRALHARLAAHSVPVHASGLGS
jgi:hypothetical protein